MHKISKSLKKALLTHHCSVLSLRGRRGKGRGKAMLNTLVVGKIYTVKHSSGIIKAEFLRTSTSQFRKSTHFIFKNLASGREIELKSKQKIRAEVE